MHTPAETRYASMRYNRCGRTGLKLPAISLGLWHNFGDVDDFDNYRQVLLHSFDLGITHFDLANNYGPPPGSAETNFGRILHSDLKQHRDELIISTKAGYTMWAGPYGDWSSRKYLIASLDQSLERMGLDYVDIFYHHRPDPETPLEESLGALDYIVRSGKAIYAGVSNYNPHEMRRAIKILRDLGTPCLINQIKYSMFERWVEDELLDLLATEGVGCIAFSPLAQGMLSDKYLGGIPAGSRASKPHGFLKSSHITDGKIAIIRQLNNLAKTRGQTLAQMALAWVLRDKAMTSAVIGASKLAHIDDAIAALDKSHFSDDELQAIETILVQ